LINIPSCSSARHVLARSFAVGCAGLLVACGGAGHPAHTGGSPTSATASSGASDSGASATAEITRAYEIFFSNTATQAQSQQALQHGDRFGSELTTEGNSSYAVKSSATVSKVTLLSPNSADVIFSVISAGNVVLKDTPGKAARENGVWKVAAQTFCALLTLQGSPPAACSDTSVTALPN
jgi:hypothetical protein